MFLAPTIKKHNENQGFGLWEPHGASQVGASWAWNTNSGSKNMKYGPKRVAVPPFGAIFAPC